MKIPKPTLPRRKHHPAPPGENGSGGGKGPGPNGGGNGSVSLKEQLTEVPIDVAGWVEERSGAGGLLRGMMYRKVPKGVNWSYTLGSATLFAFVNQAVTGVFLAMYYDPSPENAYDSVRYITNEAFLGEFVRGMHKWGATVMVIFIFLHMARTFVMGAYKYPRELNWVIGVVLLVLTLMMGLTGYLLPFDQRSFWATVVAVNINGTGPIIGPFLADFLRAGPEFGATTLSRFYAVHMLLVPGAIAALIGAHLYLVVRLGTTAPPWVKPKPKREITDQAV